MLSALERQFNVGALGHAFLLKIVVLIQAFFGLFGRAPSVCELGILGNENRPSALGTASGANGPHQDPINLPVRIKRNHARSSTQRSSS
jgi:hypothetical protein